MLEKDQIDNIKSLGRSIASGKFGDPELGPFKLLPGTWRSLPGRGWNMIALPFAAAGTNYRLLLNQYDEKLVFDLVDKGVPNRGVNLLQPPRQTDQTVVTLDYLQSITQLGAADFPVSGEASKFDGLGIHHEPGLFLHMADEVTDGLDIARLASIPHGDSVLGLGTAEVVEAAPGIPQINSLPIGFPQDINHPYLEPYKHFHDNPFEGLFDPLAPNELLRRANAGVSIARTTVLHFDTSPPEAGIHNIPFIVKQANATEMQSTFWIQELAETDEAGDPKLRMQYSQTVMLDFFQSPTAPAKLIRWPHISINTLEKVPQKPVFSPAAL